MSKEIELKLALDPGDRAALDALRRRATELGGRARRTRVYNIYFDTPRCELRKAELALRLRKIGRQWLQTLKGGGSSDGGLHQREEWEYRVSGAMMDLSLFADTPLARLSHARTLHQRLKPAFVTEFTRTLWLVSLRPGVSVELALDQGAIQGRGRVQVISEVELELLEGEPADLLDLARALSKAAVLRPSVASKAERGYRLFLDEGLKARKAEAPAVHADDSIEKARRAFILSGLHHFASNIEGALESDDPEFVHQVRVALRRLRSLLSLFPQTRQQSGLKLLAGSLGDVRDLDVFVSEVWPPLEAAFLAAGTPLEQVRSTASAALNRRALARFAARTMLRSANTALQMLELLELSLPSEMAIEQGSADRLGGKGSAPALLQFAHQQLKRRHKRLFREAHDLRLMDPSARHQLRIRAKKLRYAVDYFAGLYPLARVSPYRESLAAIQDCLGALNDAATAERLLCDLEAQESLRIFAKGWFAAREVNLLKRLEQSFEALKEADRFWR